MAAMLTRRQFLGAAPVAALTAAPDRPNVLFILADDQSWPHASAYGGKLVDTPAFDRIAKEGALFHNSFCVAPSCTPSRSGILTGRNMWQVEEAGLLYGTLPKKYPVFPLLLEDAGYFVGFTGKTWAPGDMKAGGLTKHPVGRGFMQRKHQQQIRAGLDPNDYSANFNDFLEARPKDKPFFFWFGSTEPHRVYQKGAGKLTGKTTDNVEVPPYWPDTEEIRSDILDYASEVEWYDQQVSKALDLLEKTGEMDNTLIIITSDNGMPFPRGKATLYDQGTHMPLAIRWPKRIKGGHQIQDFVSHKDFSPTILEAAGVAIPSLVAGRSLLPLLTGGKPDPTRDHLFTGFERHVMARPDGATYPMRAIRTKDFLYVRNFAPDRWPMGGDFISSNLTVEGDVDGSPSKDFLLDEKNKREYPKQYQLSFGKRPAEELFDLKKDKWQMNNIAKDPAYSKQLAQLRMRLTAYLKETGDPRIEGKDPWQQYPYRQTNGYGASFNTTLSEEERNKFRTLGAHKPE